MRTLDAERSQAGAHSEGEEMGQLRIAGTVEES